MRLLLVVTAVLLLLSPSASADRRREPCVRAGARVLAADTRGRIFHVERHGLDRWYACLRSRDRSVWIEDASPPDTDLSLPRVASPYAAVVIDRLTTGPSAPEVTVIDLRTRREVGARAPLGVSDLVLTRQGTVAFVQGASPEARVRTMDRSGRVADLDVGSIAAGSLALSPDGKRLYWLKDGVPRSAQL
jgi:hypothetical protein